MLKTNCCWNRWQSWYEKKYEVARCTSKWLPIIGQSWSFAVFSTQMDIRVLSKVFGAMEPLAFHRVLALLRTDRNHEQKLVLPRLFALSQSRSVQSYEFLDLLQKYPFCIWAWNLSFSALCIFCLAKFFAALLSQSACREVSSGVRSSKPGAHGFRSCGSPFRIMPPDCSFSFPKFGFRSRGIERISWCVPPKRSIPFLQLSVE